MNSWGKNWGEEGHFRIRRGTDESNVESMGESATPYVKKNPKKSSFVETNSYTFLGFSD